MTVITPESFQSFGDLLAYLRKRAHLTQDELSRAVGYSRTHVTRLEKNQRLPDLTTIAALFVPALELQNEAAWTARLLQLAAQAHGHPESLTITRTVQRTIVAEEIIETRAVVRPTLPAPMFPLLGRERELDQLTTLLLDPATRLLSLLGPPGVGKTTLALQVAWHTATQFADGAFWIDLAVIDEPAAVVTEIRQTLGLSETMDSEVDRVREHLRDRQTLLVLDNFEHLIAAGSVVAELLTAAPFLKVLLTSRVPLRVYGERDFPVSPLSLPDLSQLPAVTELARWPSIALFVDRACAVNPAFTLTRENALAVAAIVVRLDGLPLAIELAAPQISVMPPQELAARLVNRLAVLTRGPHNRSARQQTLRGAIEWSTQRLTPDQQILFARLGVFVGGFTAAAVAAVCGSDQLIDLIEVNLVHPAGEIDHTARFTLLETLREYAMEQLASSGEEQSVREKHAAYFHALAEQAGQSYLTSQMSLWQARLASDQANLRSALTWLLAYDVTAALNMANALWNYWYLWGQYAEGVDWLERLLIQAPARTALRMRALYSLAVLLQRQQQFDTALPYLEESRSIAQTLDDRYQLGCIAMRLTDHYSIKGQPDRVEAEAQEALAYFRLVGNPIGISWAWSGVALAAGALGDTDRAWHATMECISFARAGDDRRHLAWMLSLGGDTSAEQHNWPQGRAWLTEAEPLFMAMGDRPGVVYARLMLAWLTLGEGDVWAARSIVRELLPQALETVTYTARALAYCGLIDLVAQRFHSGVRLCATAMTRLPNCYERLSIDQQRLWTERLAAAHAELGEASYAEAWRSGQTLTVRQAVELTLSEA
ncbi:MAG: helix-turn-helix domain-containing protein [Chloroflexi bacterium]|nr:helix-turn-helix domain-containing protein [Chloroflexota bacterium]